MKTRKLVPEVVVERLVEDATTCDFCGRKIEHGGWDASEVTVEARIGDAYPECDCRDGYRLDVCPECFTNRLKPAVKALGAKFTEFDSETSDGYYADPARV